jgi:hypothetical protein
MNCDGCGTKTRRRARFCHSCGTPTRPDPDPFPTKTGFGFPGKGIVGVIIALLSVGLARECANRLMGGP